MNTYYSYDVSQWRLWNESCARLLCSVGDFCLRICFVYFVSNLLFMISWWLCPLKMTDHCFVFTQHFIKRVEQTLYIRFCYLELLPFLCYVKQTLMLYHDVYIRHDSGGQKKANGFDNKINDGLSSIPARMNNSLSFFSFFFSLNHFNVRIVEMKYWKLIIYLWFRYDFQYLKSTEIGK